MLEPFLLGLALGPPLVLVAAAAFVAWYWLAWPRKPRWMEALRHGHLPRIRIERWIRFRWIHPDCQYWILPVRFDRGPVTIEGVAPDAPYWSLTSYRFTEVNPSVRHDEVERLPDGRYRARLTTPATGRGVLYLRVYEPRHAAPMPLPRVEQGGRVLTDGGWI